MNNNTDASYRALHFKPHRGWLGIFGLVLVAAAIAVAWGLIGAGDTGPAVLATGVIIILVLLGIAAFVVRSMMHGGPVLSIDPHAVTYRHDHIPWEDIRDARVTGKGLFCKMHIDSRDHGSFAVPLGLMSGPVADIAPAIHRFLNEANRPKIHADLLAQYEALLDDKNLPDATRILMKTTFTEMTVISPADGDTRTRERKQRQQEELTRLRDHVQTQMQSIDSDEERTRYEEFLMTVNELMVSKEILDSVEKGKYL